jgi:uncharacterized protein
MKNKKIFRLLLLALIILVLPLFILSDRSLQGKMIYYPAHYLPSQAQLQADHLRFWPNGFNDYRGFVREPAAGKIKGTFIVFHGNAGTASDRAYYLKPLTQLGYRVILAEYPGYGKRSGEPGEEVFVKDAKETLRLVSEQYEGQIFLLGESLGSGVAAATIKDSSVKIGGVILITPWDTLLSVAKEKMPWLPVGWLLHDRYDSVRNLKGYQGKIVIVGAERDTLIPIAHSRELFNSLTVSESLHKMYVISRAGHNDWPDRIDFDWWKEVTDFIQ